MQVQSFKSIKAAASFVKGFKRHGRKRIPVMVKTRKGEILAVSRKTARKMVKARKATKVEQ
jgi:hypothetical protein